MSDIIKPIRIANAEPLAQAWVDGKKDPPDHVVPLVKAFRARHKELSLIQKDLADLKVRLQQSGESATRLAGAVAQLGELLHEYAGHEITKGEDPREETKC